MKVNIESKFNIGDEVYVAENYYELYACREPRVVTDVLFYGNTRYTGIRYELTHNGHTEVLPETWVFGSYEECTKWCEEHN